MLRSLFSGVSGLKNHQTRMDVIGNNISNVNTTGFKSSRVTFSDTLSQTLTGAAAPSEGKGGTNAKQIGLGSQVSAVDMLFTDGSVQSTGKNTDLCLSGSGLFVVKNSSGTYYTRNGAFSFDKDGNYVTSDGSYVQGWTAVDGTLDTNGTPGNIKVAAGKSMEAKESTKATYVNNLDSAALTIRSITYTKADGTTETVTSGSVGIGDNIVLTLSDGSQTAPMSPTLASAFTTGQSFTNDLGSFAVRSYKSVADGDVTFGAVTTTGTGSSVTTLPAGITTNYTGVVFNTSKAGKTYTLGSNNYTETIQSATANPDGTVTLTFNPGGMFTSVTVPQPTNGSYSAGDPFVVNYDVAEMTAAAGVEATLDNFTPPTGQSSYIITGTETGGTRVIRGADTINAEAAAGVTIQTITRSSSAGSNVVVDGQAIVSATLTMSDGSIQTVTKGAYNAGNSMPISTTFTIFDSQGMAHAVPVMIEKTADNTWGLSLAYDRITEQDGTTTNLSMTSSDLIFSDSGAFVSGSATINLDYANGNGASPTTIVLDLTGLTQYSGSSTINAGADGNAAGTLSSVSVDSSGIITGTYTNGVIQYEAQVAVAQFNNSAGLTKVGGSYYQQSNNSGVPNVKTAAKLGVTITPSALEMSNVDIADQFSDMIITQRGFQSNSKIITVSDEILETLINMKR